MPTKNTTVNITNRTIVRTIVWVVLAILAFRFVGRVSHVLTLIFAAFFLALALNPVVDWMGRQLKLNGRVKPTLVTYLTVVTLLTAFLALIIPPLVTQTRDFIKDVPQTVENFQAQDNSLARAASRWNLNEQLNQSAKDFASHYSNFGSAILNTSKRIVEAVVSVLVVLFLTFMMLVEGPRWLGLLWKSLPPQKSRHYQSLAQQMYRGVTGFVNGQVILAVVAGIFAFIALEIASRVVDVQINAVALAGIVAVFGVIPLFGNPISSAIVLLVCLLNSVTLALIMVGYFMVYYFIENHTFQPYLQSRLNRLTPLTVLVAALIGVSFGGFMGAIIAIPAATAVKILIEDHFAQRSSVN